MYMCFEEDDKRIAIPEHSLVNMDDNGFTIKAMGPAKSGRDMIFIKLASFQGCVQNFTQALQWIKKKPKVAEAPELEITNSAGNSLNAAAARPQRPPQAQQQQQRRPAPPPAAKLPETPSF